eukprot:31156-Pelagococcus_subviridis.AAC.14
MCPWLVTTRTSRSSQRERAAAPRVEVYDLHPPVGRHVHVENVIARREVPAHDVLPVRREELRVFLRERREERVKVAHVALARADEVAAPDEAPKFAARGEVPPPRQRQRRIRAQRRELRRSEPRGVVGVEVAARRVRVREVVRDRVGRLQQQKHLPRVQAPRRGRRRHPRRVLRGGPRQLGRDGAAERVDGVADDALESRERTRGGDGVVAGGGGGGGRVVVVVVVVARAELGAEGGERLVRARRDRARVAAGARLVVVLLLLLLLVAARERALEPLADVRVHARGHRLAAGRQRQPVLEEVVHELGGERDRRRAERARVERRDGAPTRDPARVHLRDRRRGDDLDVVFGLPFRGGHVDAEGRLHRARARALAV